MSLVGGICTQYDAYKTPRPTMGHRAVVLNRGRVMEVGAVTKTRRFLERGPKSASQGLSERHHNTHSCLESLEPRRTGEFGDTKGRGEGAELRGLVIGLGTEANIDGDVIKGSEGFSEGNLTLKSVDARHESECFPLEDPVAVFSDAGLWGVG